MSWIGYSLEYIGSANAKKQVNGKQRWQDYMFYFTSYRPSKQGDRLLIALSNTPAIITSKRAVKSNANNPFPPICFPNRSLNTTNATLTIVTPGRE